MRWWNQDLRQAVTDDNPYIEMLIPQEDLDIDPAALTPRELQGGRVREDGGRCGCGRGPARQHANHEAWTGFECGYARARGKYLLGIATGVPSEARTPFKAMCDEVIIVDPNEDRHVVFASIAKHVNARLLMDRGIC